MKEKIICPFCKKNMYFNIDSWGQAPITLYCDRCNIKIASWSFDRCIELLNKYKHSWKNKLCIYDIYRKEKKKKIKIKELNE